MMGIDGVHTAKIVTMMYRANGKAVPSIVFDIEDVHREQWKMYRGSACRSGTVSNVSRVFQERGQDDDELLLAAPIWMMLLFMSEKLHGPLNHLECSHDAATSGRVKSFFLQASNFIILTRIGCLIIEHYAIS